MIGSLHGKLTSKQAPQIVIECQGVGYEVETPMSTFLDLPSIGDDLFLFTHKLSMASELQTSAACFVHCCASRVSVRRWDLPFFLQ